ncbi:MAG TPA: DUF6602 domain-containing protein [Chloroflexia bacterium]
MSDWSLPEILAGLHKTIQTRLETARKTLAHPGTKGDASERVWLELLQTYLPKRYQAEKAHVVDSNGSFSDQIDVLVFDRQYSPFIFEFEGEKIVPAESVYAVFEAKQTIDKGLVEYAQKKVASVRKLHRTSLEVPHIGGKSAAKVPQHILGGFLALDSEWNPPLGNALKAILEKGGREGRLDIGCVATYGLFSCDEQANYDLRPHDRAATAFLFEMITRLQASATVPMIDLRAYAEWLNK